MKNTAKSLILAAVTLLAFFVMSLAACNSDIDDDPGNSGANPDNGGTNPDNGGTNPDNDGTNPDNDGANPDNGGTKPIDGIQSSEYPGFSYIEENGAITITRYSETEGGEKNITIPSEIDGKPVTDIGDQAFSGCTGLTGITIPNSVTNIGWAAFSGCTSLTSVTIEGNATTTRRYRDLFSGCTGIASLNIGKSVTNISEYSISYAIFGECTGLTAINVDPANTLYSSVDGVLYNKDKTKLIRYPQGKTGVFELPDSVTSIADYQAFSGCTGLSVTIGNSVTDDGIFYNVISIAGKGLTAINIDPANTLYSSVDGVWYNKDKTELIQCPRGKTGTLSIPDGVTSIAVWAFDGCANLTSVTIPDSVTSIDRWAFRDCTSLAGITIGNGVTSLGDNHDVFDGCTGLTSVTIGSGITYIDSNHFKDCTGLTAINVDPANTMFKSIEGVVYQIQPYLYEGLYGEINRIALYPQGRTGAFDIPNGVTGIGSAFIGCTGLTQVTIPYGVTSIGGSAFSGCTNLTRVTIPPSVTTIGNNAFYQCTSLTSITIPHVTSIKGHTFSGCTNLTKVTLVGTIPNNKFGYDSGYYFNPFDGDLRDKFYETDASNGTPGTYTTTAPVNENSKWNISSVSITVSNVPGSYHLNASDSVNFTNSTAILNWEGHLSGSSSWTWYYGSVTVSINALVEGIPSQTYVFTFISEDVIQGPENTYWYRR